jgi:carboxyl-terminal processing protease
MNERRVPLAISLVVATVLFLVFAAGFALGAVVQDSRNASANQSSDASLRDFLTAYHLVTERSYYRPFDKEHLIQAAIDGMLSATGDPHTLFLSPQQNQVANKELNGSQFSGIGAIVVPDHGRLQIVAPLPRAPAARAGIRAGDMVTRIDGRPVAAMSGQGAIARIHGRAGTVVRLTVIRGHGRPFTVRVTRAHIPPITAYGRTLPHHLGYIQIMSFGDSTSHEVADALAAITSQRVHGIILDLRDNPGGYVDAAQHVVSQFLSHGVIAYEQSLDKQLHPLPVSRAKNVTRLPLVVLINVGTASAAEITAAALHDNGRAVLVGTQSYGKGSMQSVYPLRDGSSIRITDRLWLTPKKRSIQSVGIRPDVTVEPSTQQSQSVDLQLSAAETYLMQHAGR